MPDKKRLDDLLSTALPPAPIRRGQGIRLSTDPASNQPDAPAADSTLPAGAALPVDDAPPAEAAPAPGPHKRTNAQTHKRTNAQDDEPAAVVRISQGQRLRADLIKDLKLYALQSDRKLYEVMEEAIEQYLARQRGR